MKSTGRTTAGRTPAALAVSMALLIAACTNNSSPAPTSGAPTTQATSAPVVSAGPDRIPSGKVTREGAIAPRLFDVVLTQGSAPGEATKAVVVGAGDQLPAATVKELTATLPAWDDPATLSVPFAFPTQSSPPPRPGKTIVENFPPAKTDAGTPPTVDSGPLQVLRVQPEGDVPIAPYLAITFNQPMVPVGTITQLAALDVPVKISPAVSGRWQWIGARTLRFDADSDAVDRLPMATAYSVVVPAGTKSATGGTLATDATFTFTTPAPQVESFYPQNTDSLELDPVFVATFDQRVDPAAVLKTLAVLAENEPATMRLATQQEIDADETAKEIVKNAKPGRWIAFRPTASFKPASSIQLSVGPGTPSAEGPLTTVVAQSFSNRTYGPLKIEEVICSSGESCEPGNAIYVRFTNPLVVRSTDAAKVIVSPAIPAQRVTVDASGVLIQGATKARTTYSIKVPGTLTDVFGQTLGADQQKSITIGTARKSLRELDLITTLDPFAKTPQLSVLTTNLNELRVRVFAADPTKFAEFANYAAKQSEMGVPSWTQLSDTKVLPKGEPDTEIETQINLSKELTGKPGQVIVLVEPVPLSPADSDDYYQTLPTASWVQNTTIGADAFIDDDDLQVWATDLRTGAPISGLSVLTATGENATTNNIGLATTKLPPESGFSHVVVSRGPESFVLPIQAAQQLQFDSARWYVFDDRQIYRPTETVSIKGWIRRVPKSTDELTLLDVETVDYLMIDAYGQELTKGTAKMGSLGGFDFTVAVPKTANLGPATIQLTPGGDAKYAYQHSFQIADFRRPEFEVTLQPVTPAPFLSTGPVTMESRASYLSGGALPNAPIMWNVSTSESTYSPAGWDQFTFGIFQPWWWGGEFSGSRSYPRGSSDVKQYDATTDANGKHLLQLDFTTTEGVLPDLPVSVNVAGTVTDVNRQAWSDQQTILVHSADRYVGLRSDRSFVREGEPLKIEAVVTDVDGKPQTGTKVLVKAGLLRSSYKNNEWVEEVIDPQTCDITSAATAVLCTFTTPVGGEYRIETSVTDAKGGRNRTQLSVWVSGAGSQPTRRVEREQLNVVPDKAEYAAGDTAKVLVQAPFAQGEGLAVITDQTSAAK